MSEQVLAREGHFGRERKCHKNVGERAREVLVRKGGRSCVGSEREKFKEKRRGNFERDLEKLQTQERGRKRER